MKEIQKKYQQTFSEKEKATVNVDVNIILK